MSMSARIMIDNPAEVVVTLKLTASIKELEELRDQLVSKYPSWKFSQILTDAITKARTVVYSETESKP